MDPATLSAIGSIVGGLGGLFGRKAKGPKQMKPDEALRSHAKGAREASRKYGFNPLTLLGVQPGGWSGGGDPGGAPPLASIDLITSGLAGLDEVMSGDVARRRAGEELELDLARLKLEQMRSGVLAPSPLTPVAADSIGGGATFGRRPITVGQNTAALYTPPMSRPPGKATPAMSDEGTLPAVLPLTVAGLPIMPGGAFSDAESAEARYGEVAAEGAGLGALAYDAGLNMGRAAQKWWLNTDTRWRRVHHKLRDWQKTKPRTSSGANNPRSR